MATVSLSPSPISSYPSIMSTSARRVPLSSNPNVANSPIRNSSALATAFNKQRHTKRAYASVQREEPYGQPPPAKKQLLNDGTEKVSRSPVRQVKVVRRDPTRPYRDDKTTQERVSKSLSQQEDERARVQQWQQVTRRNFPSFVFYFESVSKEQSAKIVKQLAHLGAREEKFFSKDITHVITTRPIPSGKAAPARHDTTDNASESAHDQRGPHEMPKTIDPSLLSRDTNVKDVRRRLFESAPRKLPVPVPTEDNILQQPTSGRKTDILVRAQEMKKRIWPFAKLVRVLEVLNDPDPFRTAQTPKATTEEANLAQLLNKERATGPSDRDPTVATKELVFFKGPYIYVYDIEEKQKPIMVREYAKVADKKDGDWPQFRTTSSGRCPFVEEEDPNERKRQAEKKAREKALEKQRQEAALVDSAPKLKPPAIPSAAGVGAKRSLTEMEHGHNSRANPARVPDVFDLAKAANPPNLDFTKPQNAFTSRARSARLLAGEPVASGMQPSNITSAIRSQMISSATGILGAKAGTSKELHGLQRQVLQKSNATSANPTSQDMSSRRLADMSLDTGTFQRSASLGVSSRKLAQIEERSTEHKRTKSVPVAAPVKPKKRDLKPGYCENCQDKYADFDEHILSRKHRKFAENDENWSQLDALLGQLERLPKYSDELGDESGDW
ncbi:Hsk1-interacting molecule 1 [Cytospora mali]|uniref:Hsk1-interacting molecule 1 n=1 Tax=Cytospora mali TaxID=578113 RepID=A0A194W1F6_CYTMA|nr:Hsk1-interacting molecule 1 [Valsa mali]